MFSCGLTHCLVRAALIYCNDHEMMGGLGVHSPTLADCGIGPNAVLAVEFVSPHKDGYQLSHQTSRTKTLSEPPAPEPAAAVDMEMGGFAAGGRMCDMIYPDLSRGTSGVSNQQVWDMDVSAIATVQLVNSKVFTESTGLPMPETSIRAQDYHKIGLPRCWQSEWKAEIDSDSIFSVDRSELTSSTRAEFTSHSALLNSELLKASN